METSDPVPTTNATPRRGPPFWIGVVLFLLGLVVNFVQIGLLKQTWTPWYVPLLATLGVAVMGVAAFQRRGIARGATFVLFALLCGGEWYLLVVATKSPEYSGPAQPGNKLPQFSATLADGRTFTDADIAGKQRTVLVFNRGRW